MNRRRVLQQANLDRDVVIMTSATNPKILRILYNAGLCASPDVMYKSEAEAVPDGTFGLAISNETRPCSPFDFGKHTYANRPAGEDFSAFQYFTNITTIGTYAFYTAGISKIVLPNTIKKFGFRAFMSNTFKFINVPLAYTGADFRDTQVFYYSTGTKNRSIYFPHTIPPRLQANWWVFIGTIGAMEAIYVPDGYVDTYKQAWSGCDVVTSGASNVSEWLALIKPISEYTNS